MPTIKSIINILFIGLREYVSKKRLVEYEKEYWDRKTYDRKFADRFFPKYIDFDKWAKKPKNSIDILLLNYWIFEVPEVGLTNTRLLKDYTRGINKMQKRLEYMKLQEREKKKLAYLKSIEKRGQEDLKARIELSKQPISSQELEAQVSEIWSAHGKPNPNKRKRKKVSEMTRAERLSLIAFKNVMEKRKAQEERGSITETTRKRRNG